MSRAAVVPIRRVEAGVTSTDHDLVVVEAPLRIEIKSRSTAEPRPIGLLMRTPGDDDDLVRGWLRTERVATAAEVVDVQHLRAGDPPGDTALVTLAPTISLDEVTARWALTPTSACGLCGRLSLEQLLPADGQLPTASPCWTAAIIESLPGRLRAAQAVFAETGGLHAAGLFDEAGALKFVREDIGRHNAVDKVLGAALTTSARAPTGWLLVVSGRAAFEIVQKAAVGGLQAVVAVGAPSDLAVQAARATGLTLVGFARDGRFNVYAGADRIA